MDGVAYMFRACTSAHYTSRLQHLLHVTRVINRTIKTAPRRHTPRQSVYIVQHLVSTVYTVGQCVCSQIDTSRYHTHRPTAGPTISNIIDAPLQRLGQNAGPTQTMLNDECDNCRLVQSRQLPKFTECTKSRITFQQIPDH